MIRMVFLGIIIVIYIFLTWPEYVMGFKFKKHPDANLNITQVISKYGYPVEDHYVTTEDGYILHLYRIPHGRNSLYANKKPVLVMHGLLGCAENFVVAGPTKALTYKLADEGYDVWLGNARGNKHSRNHTTLNPDHNGTFWSFSWHEIGYYDLPSMIDYILNKTNEKQLRYIGHSQGGTTLFVMLSEKPVYNKKLKFVILLAPNVLNKFFRHPFIKPFIPARKLLINTVKKLNLHEILPFNNAFLEVFKVVCSESTIMRETCVQILMMFGGDNPSQINRKIIQLIVGTSPAGSSTKQFFHYMQNIGAGKFRQYDYGKKLNLEKYERPTPPSYALQNATLPIAVFYGNNDFLTSPQDIELLSRKLPNIRLHLVEDKKFSHLDFLWAKDVVKLLYNNVLNVMEKYDANY